MAERTDMSDTVQLAAFSNGRGTGLIICLNASNRCFSRWSSMWRSKKVLEILYFVDRASLFTLANKVNLVHNLFLLCLFLVYLSFSTCFGSLAVPYGINFRSLMVWCVTECRAWRQNMNYF